jgi:hypothetical protein
VFISNAVGGPHDVAEPVAVVVTAIIAVSAAVGELDAVGHCPAGICAILAPDQMRNPLAEEKMDLDDVTLSNQTVGNIGLYYVCYRLSQLGWNVMPTARNARGVDVVLYGQTGSGMATVQVKSLSEPNPVPLGTSLDNLFADHYVIARKVRTPTPECFILSRRDIGRLADKKTKGGKVSFWLQRADYEIDKFRERWTQIGVGR